MEVFPRKGVVSLKDIFFLCKKGGWPDYIPWAFPVLGGHSKAASLEGSLPEKRFPEIGALLGGSYFPLRNFGVLVPPGWHKKGSGNLGTQKLGGGKTAFGPQ